MFSVIARSVKFTVYTFVFQGHMHTEKMKEANARAAALILEQT